MEARTSVISFHKCTSNKKALLDRYCSTFDKGTWSIKVTLPIKVTPFHSSGCCCCCSRTFPFLRQNSHEPKNNWLWPNLIVCINLMQIDLIPCIPTFIWITTVLAANNVFKHSCSTSIELLLQQTLGTWSNVVKKTKKVALSVSRCFSYFTWIHLKARSSGYWNV